MRKVLTASAIVVFLYFGFEMFFKAVTGYYSNSYIFILDYIRLAIDLVSDIINSTWFDWKIVIISSIIVPSTVVIYYVLFLYNKEEIIEESIEETVILDNKRELIIDQTNESKNEVSIIDYEAPERVTVKQVTVKRVSKTIYKKELAEIVSINTELTEYKSLQAINSLIQIIEDEVRDSGNINIEFIGKFTKKHRAARKGTNPNSGDAIVIPEFNTVTFKYDDLLYELVNNSELKEDNAVSEPNNEHHRIIMKPDFLKDIKVKIQKANVLHKSEISKLVAERTTLSDYKAALALNSLIDIAQDEIRQNDYIEIPSLGKFTKKHRAKRVGTNPNTGKPITIPEFNTVTYKPDQIIKEKLNNTIKQIYTSEVVVHKLDIIELSHRRTELSNKEIHDCLNALLEIVTSEITNSIGYIPEIGSFELVDSPGESADAEPVSEIRFRYEEVLYNYVNRDIKKRPVGKTDIIETISSLLDLPISNSKEILDAFTKIIEEELILNKVIGIPEIGKFKLKFRDAQKGINPTTKEVIYIESHNVVKFKANKSLKDRVNW